MVTIIVLMGKGVMATSNREKVIKGLESLRKRLLDLAMQDSIVMLDASMVTNAIDMLKEQEAVDPDTDSEGTCSCGNCGETVGWFPAGCSAPKKLCKFCPECGKAVKWE